MLNKILFGVGAAMLVAVFVLSKMLLSAAEANGKLEAAVADAVSTNEAQTEKIRILNDDKERLKADFEAERKRSDEFAKAVAAGQELLEKEKRDFRKELSRVRASLTVEEMECADASIPTAYFVGLCERPGDCDAN